MNQTFFSTVGFLSFLFGACSRKPSQTTVIDVTTAKPVGIVNTETTRPTSAAPSSSKFRAGQVWTFHTPAGQPDARLIVLHVEDGGKVGRIVHIALSGVSYGNGQTTISHLPFSESAIEQSIIALERESGPVPDFAEGYRLWREAFDAGKGGIFSISVAEAFATITGALHQHQ